MFESARRAACRVERASAADSGGPAPCQRSRRDLLRAAEREPDVAGGDAGGERLVGGAVAELVEHEVAHSTRPSVAELVVDGASGTR